MNRRRYGFGIYQESSKKDIDIDDEEDLDDVKDTDSDIDMDDEKEDKPKKKKSSKKKKDEDEDIDVDIDEDDKDIDIDEEEKPSKSKKKKSKNKNADIDDEDIDFEDECGDGCSSKFKCESAKDKKDNNDDADIDLDAMGSDDVDDEPEKEEEDTKPKKKEKPEKDVDFGDDNEEDDKDIDDEDDDDKSSKSKKKSSKSKSKKKDKDEEDDMDVDVDFEDECGDGCSPKQFKEYVTEKKRRNRNADVSDYYTEGATTSEPDTASSTEDTDVGDVDVSGSNEGDTVDAETECGDPVKFGTESAKSKKDKNDDLDVDFDEDSDEDSDDDKDEDKCDDECDEEECDEDDEECKSSKKKSSKSKSKKKDEEDDDEEDDDDVDFKDESMHPTKSSPDFVKPVVKEHDDLQSEYAVDLLEQEELRTERQIMTSLIDSIYKEYEILEHCPEFFDEYYVDEEDETTTEEDHEIIQERYFGGTGHKAAKLVKPIVKAGKHMNERKHGVGKKGLIRNTFHLTKKDLKKGGIIYKLLTWPFLLIKNFVRTIYHKLKAWTAYASTMRAIETTINREIAHIKKKVTSIPGMATAAGVGYVATSAASLASGKGLEINPLEFLMSESGKIIESIGEDTMLRGLTYKLASAFENAPEMIGNILKEGSTKHKSSGEKVTPEMANDSRNILTVKDGHTKMQGVINIKGVDQLLSDIDDWGEISENLIDDISDANEANIKSKISKLKEMEDRYVHHGKINTEAIFSDKGGTLKFSDFYNELASKLSDKVKQLENGLKNINEIESSISAGTLQVNEDLKKTIAEANTLVQHTCNYFMEIIDTIDDLGKYTVNTMTQYLNCLETANEQIGQIKSKSSSGNEAGEEPQKKRHTLFKKSESTDAEE